MTKKLQKIQEMLQQDHKNKKILLNDAYNFVSQEYGTDLADKLLYTNAKKLFGN